MRKFSSTKHQAYFAAPVNSTVVNHEWYTPVDIVDRARAVMGSIDLDPFSSDHAQQTIRAARYLTKAENALVAEWPIGRTLWANPPYGREMASCVNRIVDEFDRSWTEGIILVNNATETVWFQSLAQMAVSMCMFAKRIEFVHPDGNPIEHNTRGQIAIYIGENPDAFTQQFHRLGMIAYL